MCVGVSSTGQGSEVSVYTSGDRNKFSVASVKNVDVDEKNNRNVSAEGCSFGILFLFLSLSGTDPSCLLSIGKDRKGRCLMKV